MHDEFKETNMLAPGRFYVVTIGKSYLRWLSVFPVIGQNLQHAERYPNLAEAQAVLDELARSHPKTHKKAGIQYVTIETV